MDSVLLTIAIPTYNRADCLRDNLRQLTSELAPVEKGLVEIVVSDNCSEDSTEKVVQEANSPEFPIRYVRNEENLGWGLNFLQCFDLSAGKYVLLLGDDDFLVDGCVELVLSHLQKEDYGVVFLRTYGFNADFREEYPGSYGKAKVYADTDGFLMAIRRVMRLISACIVNKELVKQIDTQKLAAGNFAHLHLTLRAVLAAEQNLLINKFLVASKRNNSFPSFNFSQVYVQEFFQLLDDYVPMGLEPRTIRKLETNMLFTYYPFYLFKERLEGIGDQERSLTYYADRFGDRMLFKFWVAPILNWPRPLAVVWGAFTTIIGRVRNGELRRGLAFLRKSSHKK